MMNSVVSSILEKNNIKEAFVKLATHGIASEIYATDNYILKIPSDHPEGKSDALTESVAGPLAKMNGIKTPKLICFDNSYTLLNKTYSIWERIHGLTLGEIDNYLLYTNTWQEIGEELGKLHVSIKDCQDKNGWLDHPDRDYSKNMLLEYLNNMEKPSHYLISQVEKKYTEDLFKYKKSFVHGDSNIYNFICSNNDELLSIIDWGDAGWADPAIDFYMIPIEILDFVLKGYLKVAKKNVDVNFINRIILDKIWIGIEDKKDVSLIEKEIEHLESKLFHILINYIK